MDSQRKLQAIKAKLGEPRVKAERKGELGFICPGRPGSAGCSSAKLGKAKLWVNIDNDRFNCWVCGFHGGSLAMLMVFGSYEMREYNESRQLETKPERQELPNCSSLPDGFTPFGLSGTVAECLYRSYLLNRGISDASIHLYRVGYVDRGDISGRIVIPSFNAVGSINFWSARTVWKDVKPTYRLPHASKNIISNEHMVDWTQPIYLVEGIFDEISIGPQAISLYGKFMPPLLAQRLVELRPPVVYVCLDTDARREAIALMHRLVGYDIPCALLDLPGEDPGSLSFDEIKLVAQSAHIVTGSAGLVVAKGRL